MLRVRVVLSTAEFRAAGRFHFSPLVSTMNNLTRIGKVSGGNESTGRSL